MAPGRTRRRLLVVAGAAVLVVLIALGVNVVVIGGRIDRVAIPATSSSAADREDRQTWVIVGLDSRDAVPDGPDFYQVDENLSNPEHADAIVVVTLDGDDVSALSIPRDLLVHPAQGQAARLGVLPAQGWEAFVSGLCGDLGIPTDHLVMVTMKGFADAVDAVGGIEVTMTAPSRDAYTGLDLGAGTQTIDGFQALALVRSRHTETLVDGAWQAIDERAGALGRANHVGELISALAHRVRAVRSPWTMQRLAWGVSGEITLDASTALSELTQLRHATGIQPVTLPVAPTGSRLVSQIGEETLSALVAAGYGPGACSVQP